MAMKRWAAAAVIAAATSTALFAADPPKAPARAEAHPKVETFTDASQAGLAFKLQGEYSGGNVGVQVLSLGHEGFRAVVYGGGLPGAGWDGKTKSQVKGMLDGQKVTFDAGGNAFTTDGQTLTGKTAGGQSLDLKKVTRQSPTLGAKPPEGAIVLFDGANTDQWNGGKMTPDHLLVMGVTTKKSFQDFTLHVEFILPFMPDARGQGRGNSGVYMQNRYEVQVLDSFGLKGENNECGGIYTVAKPLVNMCFPPLQWQTYDIDFTAAKFDADGKKTDDAIATVRQNGVLIQDHTKIPHSTGGGQAEGPNPGPIQLQNHGNPVYYRNVWIVEKK